MEHQHKQGQRSQLHSTWSKLQKRSSLANILSRADSTFFLATCGAGVFLPLLDLAAFGSLQPRSGADGASFALTLILLLVTWASSGLMLAAREENRNKDGRLPPSLSLLRLLTLGLPSVGLASLPLWRALARRSDVTGGIPAAHRRWLADLCPTIPGLLWISFSGPVAIGLLIQDAGGWPGEYRPILVCTMAAVHAILAAAAFYHLRIRFRGESNLSCKLRPGLAILWLLPVPYLVFLGLLAYALCSRTRDQPSQRSALTGLDDWQSLLRKQESQWYARGLWSRLWQPADDFRKNHRLPTSTRHVRLHHRVRCYLLLLETAALILVLGELARSLPALAAGAAILLYLLLAIGLLVGTIATVLVAVRSLQRLVGVTGRLALLDRHPYHRYVAGAWLAVVAGIGLGSGLFTGSMLTIGSSLVWFGAGGAIIGMLALLRDMLPAAPVDPESDTFSHTAWMVLDVMLAMTGVALVQEQLFTSNLVLFQLELLVVYSPLFGPLVGAAAMRWLLRPYTMKSLQSGTDERRQVLGMALTLLLPFGGLLIPWWTYLHHRRWPQQQLPDRLTAAPSQT